MTDSSTEQPRPARRGPSRRDLLVAGGALIVGVGGTEAVHAATATSPSTALRPPSPGEDLMTEHGVLKRLLLAYEAAAAQLADGHVPPTEAISDAAQIIADFIEGFHEGLEEAYVFPRVRTQQSGLVTTLLTQHDRGRHLTAAISTLASGGLKTDSAKADMQRFLTLFVRMYSAHEAWEDTVIFPALREVCTQKLLDELAERFADLQNVQYGDAALTVMLGRVAGVEEQFGLQDLNSVTPPLVYLP